MGHQRKQRNSLLSRRVPITQLNDNGGLIRKVPSTLKPARTRQLIRRFHTLLKNRSRILGRLGQQIKQNLNESNYVSIIEGNSTLFNAYQKEKQKVTANFKLNEMTSQTQISIEKLSSYDLAVMIGTIDGEIAKRGGLEVYQAASIKGQDQKRGGDSSKRMVDWLKEIGIWQTKDMKIKPVALEIGSLSSRNYITSCKIFERITRIDLNSQEPGLIIQQDFFERPLPTKLVERFDLISCSLVVNFVSKPEQRGRMLRRITKFLKEPNDAVDGRCLFFFVIPLPCVKNSRYCDKQRIDEIMKSLGFECRKYHESHKLAYWLLEWKGSNSVDNEYAIGKRELHGGSKRNNFCIIMEAES